MIYFWPGSDNKQPTRLPWTTAMGHATSKSPCCRRRKKFAAKETLKSPVTVWTDQQGTWGLAAFQMYMSTVLPQLPGHISKELEQLLKDFYEDSPSSGTGHICFQRSFTKANGQVLTLCMWLRRGEHTVSGRVWGHRQAGALEE